MSNQPFVGWGGTPLGPVLPGEIRLVKPPIAGGVSKIRSVGCWQCVEPACEDYLHYLEGELEFYFDHGSSQTHFVTKRACLFCNRPQIFLSVYAEIESLAEEGLDDLRNGKLFQMWKQAALEGRSFRRVEEV